MQNLSRWYKSFALVISALLFLGASSPVVIWWRLDFRVVEVGDKKDKLDVGPTLANGEYFFPLRYVAEKTGHKVGWMPTVKTAIIRGQGKNIEITAGSKTYKDMGEKKQLLNAPFIKWERMLVPSEILKDKFGLPITKIDGKSLYMEVDPELLKPRATDFTLPDINGKNVTLSEILADKSTKCVLVNFWSTRCVPCRREMPELVKLYNAYKDRGLVVIGICTDSDFLEDERDLLLNELKVTYTILLDPLAETYYKWGGLNVPNMSLVSKDGVIVFQHDGYSPDTAKNAEEAIKKEIG